MPQSLFRKEAMEARRAEWLGSISLVQPLPLWVLTTFAACCALAAVAFLMLGTHTRRHQVSGQVVPARGLAVLAAPAAGILSRVETVEGERVRAGQLLAVVAIPRATLAVGDTAVAVDARLSERRRGIEDAQSAQALQLDAQREGLSRQVANIESQILQIDAEIALREQQVRIATETLGRLRSLLADRYVGDLQVKQQESTVLEQTLQVQQLQRQSVETRRQVAQYRQQLSELPAQRQRARADYSRDLASLEQERVEMRGRGEVALVAPVSGVLATQVFKAGQAVQQGQPIATIIPGDGRLEAELLIPSRAVGFIAPGDRVLLRYQAFPYQKFGHHVGSVARISRSAMVAGDLGGSAGAATTTTEPYYRITVTLAKQTVMAYGHAEALKPGMQLEADILGERRRLIEWIFEPLYSIKGRLGDARGLPRADGGQPDRSG